MSQERQDEPREAAPSDDLQHKIHRLFAVTHPDAAPEREYRNSEVVEACRREGRALSESHLSELRRGLKTNPTIKVLSSLAWFFDVRVGYFTDSQTAAEVEIELAIRKDRLDARLKAAVKDREDLADAVREFQDAIVTSGVTKIAHRGASSAADSRERAARLRALARVILEDSDDD